MFVSIIIILTAYFLFRVPTLYFDFFIYFSKLSYATLQFVMLPKMYDMFWTFKQY